jgi:hypothetical protein
VEHPQPADKLITDALIAHYGIIPGQRPLERVSVWTLAKMLSRAGLTGSEREKTAYWLQFIANAIVNRGLPGYYKIGDSGWATIKQDDYLGADESYVDISTFKDWALADAHIHEKLPYMLSLIVGI